MSTTKKCSFNPDWTNPNVSGHISWIQPVKGDPYSAQCTVCRKSFSLSNMGKTAVSSHASSKKHLGAMKLLPNSTQACLPSFFTRPANVLAATTSGAACASVKQAATAPPPNVSVGGFLFKTNVTRAEIIWCMNSIMTHGSFRSTAASAALFPLMFQGCEVASNMQLGKDKVGYTICHGIAPYFRRQLLSSLSSVPYAVVAFDECLNKVAQKQQMDVLVRYWDGCVKTRYLTSCFLGHSCAEDLASALRSATQEMSQTKILQVSMDGPNVNLKLLRSLKEELRSSDDSHQILDIGSCGLHVINGAYKAGHTATRWDLVTFLRSCYNLFKFVPARRADYVLMTGSKQFPMKFCSVRWLENSKVISRALVVLPNLAKFVEGSTKAKKRPTCSSYDIVEKAVGDELLSAKLAFVLSIAGEMEPFLAEFQTNKPMTPFLSTALDGILRSLLARIVKKEVLDAADAPSKLLKVDFERTDNFVAAAAFDVGFATKIELRKKPKVAQLTMLTFKRDCMSFVKACSQKIIERSPLKYKLTRGASCLDPVIALSPDLGPKRLTLALDALSENGWMSGLEAERAHRSYIHVCKLGPAQARLRDFDRKEQRLDTLWIGLCQGHEELLSLVKIVLCLSHGNATVERGFSINKECLVENLKEESLIAQRVVYDAVSEAGGVANVDITDRMVQMVRGAYSVFKEELQRRKKEERETSDAQKEKKRVATLVMELQEKKRKLLHDSQLEATLLQEKIDSLKE